MILVDTSIWIDHFNKGSFPQLEHLLVGESVLTHAFIVGEIAMGSLKNRRDRMDLLGNLHRVVAASDEEVGALVESARLYGTGLSYIDAHLLAAVLASPDSDEVRIWTKDRRLHAQAERLGVAYTTS